MKTSLKKIILVCSLAFLPCSCTWSSQDVPPIQKSWDVSRKGNTLTQEFRIPHKLNPVTGAGFFIVFEDSNGLRSSDRFRELEKFAGDGSMRLVTKESANSDNPIAAPMYTPEEEEKLKNHQVLVQHGVSPPGTIFILSKQGEGTIIPIHITIEEIDREVPETILDNVINTKGGLMRRITGLKLEPGIYRVTVSPTQDTALPKDVSTSLIIHKAHKYSLR